MFTFIDLFAGAGGLSEGFIRAGYTPLAHIEMEKYACDTLKTRAAFHWLRANNLLQKYKDKNLTQVFEQMGGSGFEAFFRDLFDFQKNTLSI